jgi:surface polysaccharide O-acyltransferase-like enzyme
MWSRSCLTVVLRIWIALIVIGSFLPGDAKEFIGTRDKSDSFHALSVPHHIWHFFAFGLIALLASVLSRSIRDQLQMLCGILLLALVIEFAQASIFTAAIEWWDLRDDLCGILAFGAAGRATSIRSLLLHSA